MTVKIKVKEKADTSQNLCETCVKRFDVCFANPTMFEDRVIKCEEFVGEEWSMTKIQSDTFYALNTLGWELSSNTVNDGKIKIYNYNSRENGIINSNGAFEKIEF